MHYLETLNSAQRRAVESLEGPLLILAGAGAGKTKTLTHRILHLIKNGVRPSSILAITFTNKAAGEMKERVLGLLSAESAWYEETPFISTFHALGVYLLRQEHDYHSRTKTFSILDSKDSLALIKEATLELSLDPKIHEPKKTKHIISSQKNKFKTVSEYSATAQSHLGVVIASIWKRYEEKLKIENAYDFDDLLTESLRILENNPEVRAKYNSRWNYVHIDEYQDTNEVQYRMSKMLVAGHNNICVVGDGDQTIYTWRGADVSNILNFEKDYPDALVVVLEENYRSTQNILLAANAVIRKNTKRKEKNLFSRKKEGDNILIFEASNDRREALFVRKTIQELNKQGVSFDDIAILYRANFQSRLLEEEMFTGGIPHIVLGMRFFDRAEVKDVLSYLRASQNKDGLSDIKRIINTPKRGIGKITIAKIFAGRKDELPEKTRISVDSFYSLLDSINEFSKTHLPSETVRFTIEKSGIRDELVKSGTEEDLGRIENIDELITFALKYDTFGEDGISRMIEDAVLASDQDSLEGKTKEKDKTGVKLMTVHSSKGLEFPYVFIVGLEQDLFPHHFQGAEDTNADDEEERRLFYVALTRGEERVILSYAVMRYIHGEQHFQEPSEFLRDIPTEIVDWEYDSVQERESFNKQFEDYDAGGAFEYLTID